MTTSSQPPEPSAASSTPRSLDDDPYFITIDLFGQGEPDDLPKTFTAQGTVQPGDSTVYGRVYTRPGGVQVGNEQSTTAQDTAFNLNFTVAADGDYTVRVEVRDGTTVLVSYSVDITVDQ